jgi:ribosome-binding protein aMBF1 (putative translation factor)
MSQTVRERQAQRAKQKSSRMNRQAQLPDPTPAQRAMWAKHTWMSGIRRERLQYGLSLRDVAEETGIQTSVLFDLEHNATNPYAKTIERLAEFYGKTPAEIRKLIGTAH